MKQRFDVSLKALSEFVATEQPQVQNRQTDLLVRNEAGSLTKRSSRCKTIANSL